MSTQTKERRALAMFADGVLAEDICARLNVSAIMLRVWVQRWRADAPRYARVADRLARPRAVRAS